MNKKIPAVISALFALLVPATTCAIQTPASMSDEPLEKPALTAKDFASLTAPQIIQKLEAHIADQQAAINDPRTKQMQGVMQNIVKDVSALAVDQDSGKVLNQKLLDLLSSQGILVTTKDGKVANPSKDPGRAAIESRESLPEIGIPEKASPEEKAKINDLIQASKALIQQVVDAKRALPNLQAVAMGLFQMAINTDPDAESLVKKYGIKMSAPAAQH